MQNIHTESEALNVKDIPNVVKYVSILLNAIDRDLKNMDIKTILILQRSLGLGIALLKAQASLLQSKELIKTGLKT